MFDIYNVRFRGLIKWTYDIIKKFGSTCNKY